MKHWWEGYPWRMIQTNLREPDMAEIDPEAYAQELADFGATVVTLNACGIVASYETRHPCQTQSPYAASDKLRRMIDACHARGIRVIARTDFTKVRYALYEQHPEWACRTATGDIINYNGNVHVCPNSDYQQKVLFEILREALTTHPFDGVFCNMSGFVVADYSGNYYGICHCENCKKRFRAFCGQELPEKADPSSPVYAQYEAFKEACTSEHRSRMYRMIKEINEDIALNAVDYIRSESSTEVGRPTWIYSASGNARLAKGSDPVRPSDNASVDYMGFRYRHISVTPELNALRQWQSLANAGSVSLYILGYPGNHRDRSAFEPTQKVFQFHKAHEELFRHLADASDTLLISNGNWKRNDPECYGWIRALTESHIPFGEIILDEFCREEHLAGKRLVVIPNAKKMTAAQAELIDAFVRKGGTAIVSGMPETREGKPLLQCSGLQSVRELRTGCRSSMFEIVSDRDREIFTRCALTPFIAPGEKIAVADWSPDAERLLGLVPEHPFGPPELCCYPAAGPEPGVVVNRFGEGVCVSIPFQIGAFYHKEGHSNSLRFMQDVLFSLAGAADFAPDLTPMVEVAWKRSGETRLLQLVNNSGLFANSCFPPLRITGITLRAPGMAGRTARTHNGGALTVREEDGDLLIQLDELNEYEAIVLEA